ncbi:MAG: acyl-CoA dehydrogenase family protein [candidate division Zixibacteria bacterium]|nr:acyl-CoA dehydrogenase family protein [candidate division Zixibacteria bacterium]
MDFSLSEEHEAIRQVAREFAEKKLVPRAGEFDRTGQIDFALVREMGEAGFLGITVPEQYGGAGLDTLSYTIVLEELGHGCASHCTIVGAHNSLFAHPLLCFGTEEQKRFYLPPICSGEKFGSFSLSEPNAGSDAAAIEATAVPDGDHFVLNGNKIFVTNGAFADYIIVMAKTDKSQGWRGITAFIVHKDTPGFSVGHIEEKLGLHASPTTELIFQDLRLPKTNILGKVGEGFKVAMESLNSGRISVGAHSLGLAGRALYLALKYSKERKQFGQPISSFQMIQAHLANMHCRLAASRLLVYEASWRKDKGLDYATHAATAKLVASEMATYVTHRAIQVLGGYGYLRDYEVERLYREARVTELYEGTSEIQRLVIARDLIKHS